jgi:hypothetical protein
MKSKDSELISCSQFEFHIILNIQIMVVGNPHSSVHFFTSTAQGNILWLSHMSFMMAPNKVPGTNQLLSWALISN